ncbi:MAG: HD domain-containing phosphohydrolase, partial [Thermaerobacterales bacterium]
SVTLGIASGLRRDRLLRLGFGAILHDVGKALLPRSLLQKPDALTKEEMAVVQEHSRYGFDIVRKLPVGPLAAHVAYQHHERLDGSGYPRGLKGEDIHLFGQIAGVADVFDAMTANRAYRRGFLPHEAMKEIMRNAGKGFNMQLVQILSERLASYPNGTLLRLSSGQYGIVARQAEGRPDAPVVRVIADKRLRRCEPFDISLADDDVAISKVLIDWPEDLQELLRKKGKTGKRHYAQA